MSTHPVPPHQRPRSQQTDREGGRAERRAQLPSEPPAHPATSPADHLISNHAEFLAAIRERKLIRIVFSTPPPGGTVDRECAPLDYGPDLWTPGTAPLYWIGNDTSAAESVPLGLSASQIINVHVLEKTFDPAKVQVPARPWYVLRDWGNTPAPRPDSPRPGPTRAARQSQSSSRRSAT